MHLPSMDKNQIKKNMLGSITGKYSIGTKIDNKTC